MATEIVFESNKGITFERTTSRDGLCHLKVRQQRTKLKRTIMEYLYVNAPSFQSPYLSWENLNCCNGWVYDDSYLHTAVQRGKKLYSGFNLSIYSESFIERSRHCNPNFEFLTEKSVHDLLSKIEAGLPDDCVMGTVKKDKRDEDFISLSMYICKNGKISDYFDINEVVEHYRQLRIQIPNEEKNLILEISELPLMNFSLADFAYKYASPTCCSHFILTGLLLGYPIETTASLIINNGYNAR